MEELLRPAPDGSRFLFEGKIMDFFYMKYLLVTPLEQRLSSRADPGLG